MLENWIYLSLANAFFLLLLVGLTFFLVRRFRRKLALAQKEAISSNLNEAQKLVKQKKERKEIASLTGLSLTEIEILERLEQKNEK